MSPLYFPNKRCVLKEMSFLRIVAFTLAKDVSIFFFYFVLLKYNLTHETYTSKMISNFPAAPEMTLPEMLGAALYLTLLPALIDFFLVFSIQKLLAKNAQNLTLWNSLHGLLWHLPILLFWVILNSQGVVIFNTALKAGMCLSLPFAGLLWLILRLGAVPKIA